MKYNWQQPGWPDFRFKLGPLEADLYAFAEKSGLVAGMLKALPETGQTQAILDVMIAACSMRVPMDLREESMPANMAA
jgi:hypothetical protein